jgi:hypothetical protein
MTAARAYITYAQVEYAISMGIKLLRLPVIDGWDADHARALLDFPNAMEMAIPKIEAIIRIRSRNVEQRRSDDSRDLFTKYLNDMTCLKSWSESFESPSISSTSGNQQVADANRKALESADCPLTAGSPQSFSDNFMTMRDSDKFLWESLNLQNDEWMSFGS